MGGRRPAPLSGATVTVLVIAAGWWLSERGAALDQNRNVVVLLTGVLLGIAIPALVGMWRRPMDPHPRRLLVAALCFTVGNYRLVEASWASTLGAAVWFSMPAL